MAVGANRAGKVYFGGEEVEQVEEILVLGAKINHILDAGQHVSSRVGKPWEAFWALQTKLFNKNLSVKHRVDILKTCVLPVATFGCAIMPLTQSDMRRLDFMALDMVSRIVPKPRGNMQ